MGHPLSCLARSALPGARNCRAFLVCATLCILAPFGNYTVLGQIDRTQTSLFNYGNRADHARLANKFIAGRRAQGTLRMAAALDLARRQHMSMLADPRAASLSAPWQAVGPAQISGTDYGNVTGRVTSIAVDPADPTGNTIYIGTTGGGVWKSVNAAGPLANVTFVPLTDTLPVFSADSGNSAIASLSIGALSISNGVILAGTGDTNDALDSYYGSGLLRSADGGLTWTLVRQSNDGVNGAHAFTGLGFAGFAWSGANPLNVVAAVSDAAQGVLVNAEDATYSTRGLYFSNDAGLTWQMATIKDASQIVQAPKPAGGNQGGNAATAVAWNPVRQRFYAAVRYHGYYESVDGSVWTRLAAQPGLGLTAQACPANPNMTGSASCPIFRGALAVEPASGDLYAFTVDAQLRDQGIWRDVCASNGTACASNAVLFGSRLDTTMLEEGPDSATVFQGDYNLSLAAIASGAETTLFAGTVDLFRCSFSTAGAGGSLCVFRNTTNTLNGCAAPAMVAPAQHAIATAAATDLLFLGNDGGVWRSLDGADEHGEPCSADDASHFQNLNGGLGSLAEVVSFAQHPSDPGTLIVGVGANGTAATSAASLAGAWPQVSSGEGGFAAIDPNAPANWYVSTAAGVNIAHCGNGAACTAADFSGTPTIGPTQVARDASAIDAPWILDPAMSANVVIGTCRIWRGPAADGSSWSAANAISPDLGTAHNAACSGADPLVRSIAAGGPALGSATAANAGSKVLYAGLQGVLDGGGSLGGHVFSTRAGDAANGVTPWSDLALSPVTNDVAEGGVFNPGGFDVSSIEVDPHDTTGLTVYATVMGFAGNALLAPHVYRSADGGAHWLNISSNLPNAPANSLAVDPNDANTVYVALDTGVYLTQQVSNCANANCWSIYGTGLPNAPVISLAAASAMPGGAGMLGMLRAATYGRGIWQIPLLTASAPVAPVITLGQAALSFSPQAVGSASAPQNLTVSNTGSAPLTLRSLTVTGDFHETDDCTGTPVAVNGSCSVQVSFSPTATGLRTGLLTIYGNVAGGQATVSLSGTGAVPAAVVLNPLNLNFGTIQAGSTSPEQDLSVANTGGVAATLQTPVITGDFRLMANTCGTILPGDVGCTMSIAFVPTRTGTRNGTLTLATSTGTQVTSLTGVGSAAATDTLSPLALTFASQQYGTTASPKTVTLTNSGDAALTGITAQITNGDFTVTGNCASSLVAHAACSFLVSFVPKSAGQLTGTLAVSDEFQTQTVALLGTATAPPIAAASSTALSFPATVVGQNSDTQPITITNAGDGQLVISKVAVSGDFTDTEGCTGGSFKNQSGCIIRVRFSPTTVGSRTGTLTVSGNSAAGAVTVALAGTGATPAAIVLTPSVLDFGSLTQGTISAAQNITVSNTGGVAAALQVPRVSTAFRIAANTCGTTLAPDTGCTVAVVFAPTVSGKVTGSFTIQDSAGVQMATLTGTGQTPATDTLSPLSLSFATQSYGTVSAPQTVRISNTGDQPLTLIAAQVAPADYAVANNCGPVLSAHSDCTVAVTFSPLSQGQISGTLTVSDQFRIQTVALSGTGIAPPLALLAPTMLSFPATVSGQSSTAQTVTVTNSGGGQLQITSIAVTGEFSETDACLRLSLANRTSCAIQVKFSPRSAGTANGTLTLFGNMPGGQANVPLSGTGTGAASIVLLPTSVDFGKVTLGASSSAENITLSNTGGAPATLQPPAISGSADFRLSANTCGATLAADTGCTVAILFTPSVSGLSSAVFSITGSAGTQTASLTGIGQSPATDDLSPLTLSFAAQQIETTSPAQAVTLTNTGDNALTLITAQITSGDFIAVSGCGVILAGHSQCTIAVSSAPKAVGNATGVLTVADQFRSQSVALSGVGTAPPGVSLSPFGVLVFPATGVTATSAPQTVTLSNKQGVALAISAIAVAGDFAVPPATNTCGSNLAAEAACTFQVVFAPTESGLRTGSISLTNDAPGSPETIALQGTGIDFSLDADGAVSASVASGTSAVYPLLLRADPATPGNAVLSCTGTPANTTCFITPSAPPLSGTTVITVTLATGVATSSKLIGTNRILYAGLVLPLLLVCSCFSTSLWRGRSGGFTDPALLVVFGLLFVAGCGAGRVIPPPPGGTGPGGSTGATTPSGTYPITVSASSAGLTRSVGLTLVVR